MSEKIKILVAGIGGVGGYFGGLLAKKYPEHPGVEVVFLARGEHLRQIREQGLKVVKGAEEFTARPALATDDTDEIGTADLVLLCTKGYDLEPTIQQLKPCTGEQTLLLPLLNGVDATEKIQALLPDNIVLQGCVYIVSKLKQAGIVENTGNIQTLYFGTDHHSSRPGLLQRLATYENIFKQAGIEASLSDRISEATWEKFIFLSPLATATSYYDVPVGKVLAEHEEDLRRLIGEVAEIARAKGMNDDPEIIKKTLQKIKSLPAENTSSMHNDYKNGKPHTEVDSLTGYIIRAGKEHRIPTPMYDEMYGQLVNKKA